MTACPSQVVPKSIHLSYPWVSFEAVPLVIGGLVGVAVVEGVDEADGDAVTAHPVHEAAAVRAALGQRVAERVHHLALHREWRAVSKSCK